MNEELRKELIALDGLLSKLMPEDDLARLALDPKRQAAAAQMLGAVTLARGLVASVRKRLEETKNGVVIQDSPRKISLNRTPDRGRAGAYILKRLERASEPLLRNDLANEAVKAGHATATPTVYAVMHRLVEDGRVAFDEANNSLTLVRQ